MQGLETLPLISRWPRLGLNLVTVTVVAYFLAGAAVTLFVDPGLPRIGDDGSGAARMGPAVSVPPLKIFSPIRDRNLFKAAMPEAAGPTAESLEEMAVAKVGSKLLGTMYSDVPSLSRAVIMTGNKQRMIKAGDALEGFRVVEVQRRAIVLEKAGTRQLLLIDDDDKKVAAKEPGNRVEISRREIKRAMQRLPQLSSDIRFATAEQDKEKRLWVRQLRAGSLFSKVGLMKGDVVLRVGGQDVTLETEPKHLFNLLGQEQVDVDLVRNGKPMKLTLVLTR